MMYRVIWRRTLIDQMTRFYTETFGRGGDTAAITRAVARIDRLLESNPEQRGESRADYERVLIVSPLTVTFEVFTDEQTVVVLELVYHPAR